MLSARVAAGFLAVIILSGCQEGSFARSIGLDALAPQQPRHVAISKAGSDAEAGKRELAECIFNAESGTGPAPTAVSNPFQKTGWNNERDRLTILCLESKGYTVSVVPGECYGACTHNTEIIADK